MVRSLIAVALLSLVASPVWAQQAEPPVSAPEDNAVAVSRLALGDVAPTLSVATWHRGEAVTGFEEGRVYVVEFWATWCGPCLKSIPHMSELQTELGDKVTIVGVSEEETEVVAEFLKDEKRPQMQYRVASDLESATKTAFMDAFGVQGIPSAFIVGKTGRIEWVGHPQNMDPVLTAVIEDRFDSSLYATWKVEHDARSAELTLAQNEGRWEDALAIGDALIADHEADTLQLFGSARNHENQRFQILLQRLGRIDEAYVLGEKLVQDGWDDAGFLNNFSWYIVDQPNLPKRDLELAMVASTRSNILTHGHEGAYLDTLARVYFEQGAIEYAVLYQSEAVVYNKDPQIQQTLETYQRALDGTSETPRLDRSGRRRDGI